MDRRFERSIAGFGGIGGSNERLHDALEASCVVGTWDLDHVRQVIVYDAGAAQLLTGDPDLAGKELTGLISIAAVHPADHAWLIEHVGEVTRAGGLFLVEYRVMAEDGTVRWLLSRGRTYLSANGHPLRSCGILIDITEMHEGDERYAVRGSSISDDPLERVTDLALALKKSLGPDAPAGVRAATELLLISLGQTLARIGRH